MNPRTAAAALYKEATFENAPPIKIVHMMYEGALRFLDQAMLLDPQGDKVEFGERINRAEAVVSELRLSLSHEGEAQAISESLNALYLFVEGQLREAFLESKVEPLHEAREILAMLHEGWQKIDTDQMPQG